MKNCSAVNEKILQHLKECRSHDDVTPAYNYPYFVRLANVLIKMARNRKLMVSMLLVDIVELERINVRRSYAKGNAVLKHLYRILENCSRDKDIIGRFGGSGFFMLLYDCKEEELVDMIVQIQTCLANPSCVKNTARIPYRIRFGGVTMHGKHIYLNSMLNIVEEALNNAKLNDNLYAIADHTGMIVKSDKTRCR
ncbi:GGDEF domain-containing protein [Hydrogenimonas sp.]